MTRKHKGASIRGLAFFVVTLINVIIVRTGFTSGPAWYYLLLISAPMLVLIGFVGRRSPDRK